MKKNLIIMFMIIWCCSFVGVSFASALNEDKGINVVPIVNGNNRDLNDTPTDNRNTTPNPNGNVTPNQNTDTNTTPPGLNDNTDNRENNLGNITNDRDNDIDNGFFDNNFLTIAISSLAGLAVGSLITYYFVVPKGS